MTINFWLKSCKALLKVEARENEGADFMVTIPAN